jgi:hypothetical protein
VAARWAEDGKSNEERGTRYDERKKAADSMLLVQPPSTIVFFVISAISIASSFAGAVSSVTVSSVGLWELQSSWKSPCSICFFRAADELGHVSLELVVHC